MPESLSTLFTVGVFQDVAWAEKGLTALAAHGFPRAVLSVIVRDTPEAEALLTRTLGAPGDTGTFRTLGAVRACGPMVTVLDGADAALTARGLGAVMGRAGFQAHDGHIFEALTARGGVLVAIRSEDRAADALALLHAYGGGNAAIGAWAGRV